MSTLAAFTISDQTFFGMRDAFLFTLLGVVFVTFYHAIRALLLGHERGWIETATTVSVVRGLLVSTVVGWVGIIASIVTLNGLPPGANVNAIARSVPIVDADALLLTSAVTLWLTYRLVSRVADRLAGRFGGDDSPEVTTA